MKSVFVLVLALSFAGLISAQADFSLFSPPVVAYVDSISTWWGCGVAQALGLPASGQSTAYNTVILSFWISSGTPADAVSVWSDLASYIPDNCGYGSDSPTIQQNLISAFHNAGINVLVSAFGSTDYPTSEDPTATCSNLAQFILDNNLDGVDLDYEDTSAFNSDGDGENWLITCTQVLRQTLTQGEYIITHAPQGPYFTTAGLYPQTAYLMVDQQVGSLIDWYNVQYYNQGDSVYTTYQDLVVACSAFPGTAMLELSTHSTYGIAVGKPVTSADASNGWVDPSDLVSWLQQANSDNGWCGGVMYWQMSSDSGNTFGTTLRSGLQGIGSSCSF